MLSFSAKAFLTAVERFQNVLGQIVVRLPKPPISMFEEINQQLETMVWANFVKNRGSLKLKKSTISRKIRAALYNEEARHSPRPHLGAFAYKYGEDTGFFGDLVSQSYPIGTGGAFPRELVPINGAEGVALAWGIDFNQFVRGYPGHILSRERHDPVSVTGDKRALISLGPGDLQKLANLMFYGYVKPVMEGKA